MDMLLMDTQKVINTLTSGLIKENFVRKEREFSNESISNRDEATMASLQVRLSAEASDKVYDPFFAPTARGIKQYVTRGQPKEAAYAMYLLERVVTYDQLEAIKMFYSFGAWENEMTFGLSAEEYKNQIGITQKGDDMAVYYDACIIYSKIAKAFMLIGKSILNEISLDSVDPKHLKKAIEVILLDSTDLFGDSNAIGLRVLRDMHDSREYLSKEWPRMEKQLRGNEGIRKFQLKTHAESDMGRGLKKKDATDPAIKFKDQLMKAAQFLCYGIDGINFVPRIDVMENLSNEEIVQMVNSKIIHFIGGQAMKSLIDSIRKNVPLLKLELDEQRGDYRNFLGIIERTKEFGMTTDVMVDAIRDEIRVIISDQPDLKDLHEFLGENPDSMQLLGYDSYNEAEKVKTPQELVLDFMQLLHEKYKDFKSKGDSWQEMGYENYLDDMIHRGIDSMHKPLFTYLFRETTDVYGQEDFEAKLNEVLEKSASNLMGSLNFSIQQAEKTPSERHFIEWYIKTIEIFEASFEGLLEKYNLSEVIQTDLDEIHIELKTCLKIMHEQNFRKPFVDFIEKQKYGKPGKFLKHRINYFSSLYQKILGFSIYNRIQNIREHIRKIKAEENKWK